MNKPIMKEFYDKMLEGDNLKTAQSLKSMLDDLVLYRVERIIDEFKSDLHPFHKIANWANNDAYFTNCFWGDAHLGIDVGVEPDSYTFSFWDRNDEDGKKKHAQSALEKMKCIDQYRAEGGEFKKVFAFPAEENELYQHIRSFKTRLSKVMPETTAAG